MQSKFTGEDPCRSVIPIKLLCKFIEITLRHGCSPVICCIFLEHHFLRTPPDGCFCQQLRLSRWRHCILNIVAIRKINLRDRLKVSPLILTHPFPMHPFSTPRKHEKTVRCSNVFKGQRKGALRTNGLNKFTRIN